MEFPSRFRSRWLSPLPAMLVGMILVGSARAQGRFDWEAYSGEPLGVGRLAVEVAGPGLPDVLGPDDFRVADEQGRVVYPAFSRQARKLSIRNLVDARRQLNVYFLFRDDGPLEVTFLGEKHTLTPGSSRLAHRRLLGEWWDAYCEKPTGLVERILDRQDDPNVVELYLRSMLARRLKLPPPPAAEPWQETLADKMGLMFQSDDVRLALLGERMLHGRAPQPADQPLPDAPAVAALDVPEAADVAIEPIALHVPHEAFYLRFGSFSNYLWFRDTLARAGGDLSSLITLKAVNQDLGDRMERQLGVKETALSRLMGDAVIADVALIGTDLFLSEGASLGILFEARSSTVLAADLVLQRAQAMAATPGAREESVTIEGKPVSLIASPDNAMRSFYASDGAYHLVTNSRALAERFLQTSSGEGSLGSSAAFRHARTLLPLARGDTVTVFLSDAFYQNLFEPRTWVELSRRLEAAADLQAVQLAVLAAQAEGKPRATIEELQQGGLLPPEFGPRADGSRALLEAGRPLDSVRGGRGTLAPIPDVPVERITADEAAGYARLQESLVDPPLRQIGPVALGIARSEVEGSYREEIRIDFAVSPVASDLAFYLEEILGDPTTAAMGPVEGDIAWGQLVLADQTLFGGLRDFDPPLLLLGDSIVPMGLLRDFLYGYLGTDGPGLESIDWLQVRFEGELDAQGYSRGVFGLWKRTYGPHSLYSFHREILDEVSPMIASTEMERPAQLRLHIGDPEPTRVAALLNRLGYNRARAACRENVQLMHAVSQQFGVPMSEARTVAEAILDGRLVAPLGGDYRLVGADARGRWIATDFEDEDGTGRAMPANYQSPPLNWLRLLDLDAAYTEQRLTGHAEILIDWPE